MAPMMMFAIFSPSRVREEGSIVSPTRHEKPALLGIEHARRIEALDAILPVDDEQASACREGGRFDHLAVVDDGELGRRAADIDE